MITKSDITKIYMTAIKVSFKYIPLLIVRSLVPALVIAIITLAANEKPIGMGILYLLLLMASFVAATVKRLFLAKELIKQLKDNNDLINKDDVDITKDSDMIITILILLILLIISSYTLTHLSIINAISFSIVILIVSLLAKLI